MNAIVAVIPWSRCRLKCRPVFLLMSGSSGSFGLLSIEMILAICWNSWTSSCSSSLGLMGIEIGTSYSPGSWRHSVTSAPKGQCALKPVSHAYIEGFHVVGFPLLRKCGLKQPADAGKPPTRPVASSLMSRGGLKHDCICLRWLMCLEIRRNGPGARSGCTESFGSVSVEINISCCSSILIR
jgi:hypothetical protein